MVYPRFNPDSFWNYQATCELVGAKYPAAPLGMITVAAMLPESWVIRLVNRNTEEMTEADLDWADMVMTGGMLPQQRDALEIIRMVQAVGKPVVVGGPDATSSPHVYQGADFLVLGEAEGLIDRLIEAWHQGAEGGVFEGKKFQADVTRSPVPRFDLLKLDQYLNVGVQFSRGCPFNCEFCDIIELYGRVPRNKTTTQMLAELEELYRIGYRGHVDFVDDQFIGNKKVLKTFLPALTEWLKKRNYPFEFSTEASINLADDPVLLDQMKKANFFAVFVGIESPDTDTLVSMQKRQNTRRSLVESVKKIYEAGIFVNGGFIVGFDTEKASVAEGMIECIEETAIPACMVGLLYALPNTQLTRRLEREGRLFADHDIHVDGSTADQCTAGLNFTTLRERRDALHDYKTIIERIYEPAAYFGRVRRVGRALDCSKRRLHVPVTNTVRDLRAFGRMVWRMGLRNPELRAHFWKTFFDCVTRNPRSVKYVVSLMALYMHFGPFSRYLVERLEEQIASIDAGAWKAPTPVKRAACAGSRFVDPAGEGPAPERVVPAGSPATASSPSMPTRS